MKGTGSLRIERWGSSQGKYHGGRAWGSPASERCGDTKRRSQHPRVEPGHLTLLLLPYSRYRSYKVIEP